MGRRIRRIGRRDYPPRRVAYRMMDGRKFYEPQPRKFPYGVYNSPCRWIIIMATTLTLREVKGSPLTFGEMDANLTSIDSNKQEIIQNLTTNLTIDETTDKFSFYDDSSGTTRSILPKNVGLVVRF